jgi:hypothetical protein
MQLQELKFDYTTTITNTYKWQLVVNTEGVHFHDLSGAYYYPEGKIFTQSLSDFWFYGNLMPLPDLALRKRVIDHLAPIFKEKGNHFTLFEYPEPPIDQPSWEIGDYNASDYVIIRWFGIEYGSQNWHDGLVFSVFVSFENFLYRPDIEHSLFTPEIKKSIKEYLSNS